MFGPERAGAWRKLRNEEFYFLYNILLRGMGWAGTNMRNAYETVVRINEGKSPLGRP
jgi:hypothetical protein